MTSPRTFGWANASAQRSSLPSATSPPRTSSGNVVAAATERMSSTAGIFSHVYALVDPSPAAMWIDRTTACVDRSFLRPFAAQQHLAAVELGRRDALGAVAGHPVVQLEARPDHAAAVHRAEDVLPVEPAQYRQVLSLIHISE